MDGVLKMMQRTQRFDFTWDDVRHALSRYFPTDVEAFDKHIREDDKRAALKIATDRNIISKDAWVIF